MTIDCFLVFFFFEVCFEINNCICGHGVAIAKNSQNKAKDMSVGKKCVGRRVGTERDRIVD